VFRADAVAVNAAPSTVAGHQLALRSMRRHVFAWRVARAAIWVVPLALWATLGALSGSWWSPGMSILRWELLAGALVVAFVCSEELAAVVRHRSADLAAAAQLDWLDVTGPAPRGADLVLEVAGAPTVAVVVDDDCNLEVGARRFRGRAGMRRGLGVRQLRAAAPPSAEPIVVVAHCAAPDRCAGVRSAAGVEVVCPSVIATEPVYSRCEEARAGER
jgi:hypothetical protein